MNINNNVELYHKKMNININIGLYDIIIKNEY